MHQAGYAETNAVGRTSEVVSLTEFLKAFPTDEDCLTYFWRARFAADGESTHCAACGQMRSFRRYGSAQRRRAWTCIACGRHLHPTVGTIFEKSSTPLGVWFYAAYLLEDEGRNLSVRKLAERLKVTQKTAWRIRNLVSQAIVEGHDWVLWGRDQLDTPAGDGLDGKGELEGPPNALDRVKSPPPRAVDRNGLDDAEARAAAGLFTPGVEQPLVSPLHNVPVPLTGFVGRVEEIKTVQGLLNRARLVTLVGAGGCGKTRLAIEVGLASVKQVPDGVWWVDLGDVTDNRAVAAATAAAVGLPEQPEISHLDNVIRYLRARSALVVFDNCEHLLDGCAAVTGALLGACAGISLLSTSREPLGLVGETVWRVPSMSAPDPVSTQGPAALAGFDAVRLFVERAAAVDPTFQLDAANAHAVARICQQLDGIPLAIEMAAARVAAFSALQIARQLQCNFNILTAKRGAVLSRHLTLRASMDWSYALLDQDERILLVRLTVFVGSFSVDAVECVCGHEPLDRGTAAGLLARLIDKSLLVVEKHKSENRYRLLETVRQYAMGRLLESGDMAVLRDRHLDYAVALVERAAPELTSREQTRWLELLEAERPNVRAALEWSISSGTGREEEALRLVSGLTFFFTIRIYTSEGRRWFADALGTGIATPSLHRARALWGTAYIAMNGLDAPGARTWATAALEMARHVGDSQTVARALGLLGSIDVISDPRAARLMLEEGAMVAREIDDEWCQCHIFQFIGRSWIIQGALELARRSLAATYNVISQGGNQFFLAWHWVGVTLVALKAGDLDQADAGVEQAYGLVAAVGNPICEAWAARCSVEVECWRGRARQAWASLTATRRDDGFTIRSPSVGMLLHASTGIVALALGRLGDADRELREALAIARAAGYVAVEGDCLVGLAEIALLRRQADDARILATEIQRCSRILDNAWLDAAAKFVLSRAETDREQAREFCHQALALQSESGYRLDAVMTVEALAQLQARRGNHVDAARLYGAADAERRRLGARFRPLDVLRHRETRAAVATSLEIATLRRALNEGAALSFNDAIAYAGRGRGSRGGRPIIGWASLTSTEKAVARLVSEGLTNREIAGRLLMSTSTVKTHLAHIFGKLAISHRAELASRATQSLHLLD